MWTLYIYNLLVHHTYQESSYFGGCYGWC